jgi:hypothetical protein
MCVNGNTIPSTKRYKFTVGKTSGTRVAAWTGRRSSQPGAATPCSCAFVAAAPATAESELDDAARRLRDRRGVWLQQASSDFMCTMPAMRATHEERFRW